jgi:hypothetical protein
MTPAQQRNEMLVNAETALRKRYGIERSDFLEGAIIYTDSTPAHKFFHTVDALPQLGCLILITARDNFDIELCASIRSFCQTHCKDRAREVSVLRDFSCPGPPFELVAVQFSGEYYAYRQLDPWMAQNTFLAFPAFRCELSGTEDLEQFKQIQQKGPCMIDWKRTPFPLVRMRRKNMRTGADSLSFDLQLSNERSLRLEIEKLPRDAASYLEFENFMGDRYSVHAVAEGYQVKRSTEGSCIVSNHAIDKWITDCLYTGQVSLSVT